ncbi:hypothetical protein Droror1_Dr00021803 [Drosera rotundifolia]
MMTLHTCDVPDLIAHLRSRVTATWPKLISGFFIFLTHYCSTTGLPSKIGNHTEKPPQYSRCLFRTPSIIHLLLYELSLLLFCPYCVRSTETSSSEARVGRDRLKLEVDFVSASCFPQEYSNVGSLGELKTWKLDLRLESGFAGAVWKGPGASTSRPTGAPFFF